MEYRENQKQEESAVYQKADVSSKRIFGNHTLCAQFLRGLFRASHAGQHATGRYRGCFGTVSSGITLQKSRGKSIAGRSFAIRRYIQSYTMKEAEQRAGEAEQKAEEAYRMLMDSYQQQGLDKETVKQRLISEAQMAESEVDELLEMFWR